MTEVTDPKGPPRPYTVVLKGPSSARLPYGSGARFFLTTDSGSVEVRVKTNWVEAGFDHPLPRELWVDVRLHADSVDNAIIRALTLVNATVPVIAFATNAEVGSRAAPRV